jgi:PAS domain S-box-containing protein
MTQNAELQPRLTDFQAPGVFDALQASMTIRTTSAALATRQVLQTLDATWLFGSGKDALILLDGPGRILAVSGQTEKMFGYLSKELVGEPIEKLLVERFREQHAYGRAACASGQRTQPMETVLDLYGLRKDGCEFPIQISLSPLETDEGTLLSSAIRDVGDQGRAKEPLSHLEFEKGAAEGWGESEERFRIVASTAPLMIWMAGTDKQCTYFNQRWLAFTGRAVEQEHGEGWVSGVHPEDLNRCMEIYSHAFDERAEFQMEYRLRRFDGEYRWIVDYGVPRYESHDSFRGYIGFCLDISDQKLAEQALLETSERLAEANQQIAKLNERLESENVYLQREVKLEHHHYEVVGDSESIRRVLQKAEQVAPTDSTVLILGETGTGKELIARTIHDLSRRKGRLMVKVNCAALPASLVESELFGREKGAFTGALTREIGRFELANCSTILLDEIGELPIELQSKLLRVLQEGEFERLGGPKTIKVDVRVIAATSRNLQQAVREGKFREDLFYRLNVFPITIPALRERREDIPPLVWHFVEELSHRMGRSIETIHGSTMDAFKSYPWPGNIRELRNVIERFLITSTNTVFRAELPAVDAGSAQTYPQTFEEVERNHILHIMETAGWRVRGEGGAAQILGLKPTTLESRMQKLGITRHK